MLERELWVDYAKAIGIILVVYGHVERGVFASGITYGEQAHYLLDSFIYSFHMPLFFFLSGLFYISSLKKRDVNGVILNKAQTIFYPYIVWSLLQGLIEVALSSYSNNHTTLAQVLALLWAPRAQFWFLYALFLMTLLGIAMYKNLAPRFYLAIFLISAILYSLKGFFFEFNGDLFYFPAVKHVVFNFVFFSFGIFFQYKKSFFVRYNKVIFPLATLVFIAFQWYFHFVLGETFLTKHDWLGLTLALVSIVFVSSLSMILSNYRINWLAILGASSMTIYLMHVLVASGVRVLLQKFLQVDDIYIHLISGSVIGIFLPLLVMNITKQKLNFLFFPPSWLYFKK
ncbi:MAG TPA: acyltransferase [Methylophilaceae bacterium]|nr:acyltransferase [Methylophilaceae bacterium]HAJ72079.1 acyltransferase [Methylophilaceae bacterium]